MFCENCGASIPDDSMFCPMCGKKQAPVCVRRICPACGAELREGSRFCENCGARIAEASGMPPVPAAVSGSGMPPAPAGSSTFPSDTGEFTRTHTLMEALPIAIKRNPQELWSKPDYPDYFEDDAKTVSRYCEKEDKYIAGCKDREGVRFYVVSPDGSIGVVAADVLQYGEPIFLAWLFLAPGDEEEGFLPQTPEEL